MPIAHICYRCLRSNQNYDYRKRRQILMGVVITYAAIFIITGFVFLGLQMNLESNYYDNPTSCIYCQSKGFTFPCPEFGNNCGYGSSCDVLISTQQCQGDIYSIQTVIYACVFSYAGYELIVMICYMCNGKALKSTPKTTEAMVVDRTPLNTYVQPGLQTGIELKQQIRTTFEWNTASRQSAIQQPALTNTLS